MANYTVKQVALKFGRSDQRVREVAKTRNLGEQIDKVWQFSDDDLVVFQEIFDPQKESFASKMNALTTEVTAIQLAKPFRNSDELFAGAIVPFEETQDYDFDGLLTEIQQYNQALEEDLVSTQLARQDLKLQHERRVKLLDAELFKMRDRALVAQESKKILAQETQETQSVEMAKAQQLIRLKRLGVTPKKF